MDQAKDWRSFFLPAHAYEDGESLRVYRFFIATCFVTAFFASSYFFMSMYMQGFLFAENMAVSVGLFLTMPFLLRWGVPLPYLANAFVAVIAIVASLQIYWDGGIRTANTAPWLVILPAFAMMLQGTRVAAIWLLIAIMIIAGFSYFQYTGMKFRIMFDISKDPLFHYLSLTGLVSLITLIFYISERERKKAQDNLKAQNTILDKLSKEKTRFLQIAAHDLRNPLVVIKGLTENLSDPDLSDEDRQACLNYIGLSTERMSELIKNLLEIQVIDAGKMAVSMKQVSLTNLINSYIAQTARVASVKQTNVYVDLPETEISLHTDPARIEQILDNYVSNAIKYSPINSNVYIQLTEGDSHISLTVRDEGPGLSTEELAKLFKQFSTASSVPRSGEHATGLDLAIVKKIADALGAEVGCESEKGKGCTFYIRLPKA